MKFFADIRTKRNTALAMLLVWVFALASGVANACFLNEPGHDSTAVKGSAARAKQAPAELVADRGATAAHHDDAANTKESCLKVCEDGKHSLLKATAGVDQADPGPPPLVTTLWTGSMAFVLAPRRLNDLAIPILGPPLRVRYARLAL